MSCAAMQVPDPISEARSVLASAKRILILTGAGISAESGVPTFRGEGGYWRNKSFQELASPKAFAGDPRLVWDWYLMRRQTVAKCRPNEAHVSLTNWARRTMLSRDISLFTQNVDGLHEASGFPGVVRLHGSLWRNCCTACGFERDERSLEYPSLPQSPCCKALERPAIVWFGEDLPRDAVMQAVMTSLACEVVLVVGTSGAVSSAAKIIACAKEHKAVIIDVNPDIDALDVHIRVRGQAASVLPLLLG